MRIAKLETKNYILQAELANCQHSSQSIHIWKSGSADKPANSMITGYTGNMFDI